MHNQSIHVYKTPHHDRILLKIDVSIAAGSCKMKLWLRNGAWPVERLLTIQKSWMQCSDLFNR